VLRACLRFVLNVETRDSRLETRDWRRFEMQRENGCAYSMLHDSLLTVPTRGQPYRSSSTIPDHASPTHRTTVKCASARVAHAFRDLDGHCLAPTRDIYQERLSWKIARSPSCIQKINDCRASSPSAVDVFPIKRGRDESWVGHPEMDMICQAYMHRPLQGVKVCLVFYYY